MCRVFGFLSRHNIHHTMTSVYILKLGSGKWYVGRSGNADYRIHQHRNGEGSAWTQKYGVLGVHAVHPDVDNFDEDAYVKRMMAEWGVDNVRGGAYSQFRLDSSTRQLLEREIRNARDTCFKCGGSDHFAADCRGVSQKRMVEDVTDDIPFQPHKRLRLRSHIIED